MRRFYAGVIASSTRGAMGAATALAAALLAVAPAGAAITSTTDAEAVRAALVGSGLPAMQTPFLTVLPPQGDPVGIGDTVGAPTPFPRNGSSYVVLSTGNATLADQPGTVPSVATFVPLAR